MPRFRTRATSRPIKYERPGPSPRTDDDPGLSLYRDRLASLLLDDELLDVLEPAGQILERIPADLVLKSGKPA